MYKYRKKIRNFVLALAVPASMLTLTGCNDFLDTLPLNDVILENYWTQKADVQSVLNGCYEGLQSRESMYRMSVWGEMRSDNLTQGNLSGYMQKDKISTTDIQNIFKENILPTNDMANWAIMYTTINRCNTVIHYAPQVQEVDPNYSIAEMKANIAEASFIRDLCYFYLIRAFRDVPVSFEPSIDDLADYRIAATPMNEALDMLIADLESVKDDAVKRYVDDSSMSNASATLNAYENSSRVTRVAIYALLADLNLWRGNYDETVKYADMVIDFKKDQYKQKKSNIGTMTDMTELYGIPLILEKTDGSSTCGNAYTEIFGNGNSFESLFELYFKEGNNVKDSLVSFFYGNSNQSVGLYTAPSIHRKDVALGNCPLFSKNDCRAYEMMTATNASRYTVRKYVNSSFTMKDPNNTAFSDEATLSPAYSTRGDEYANWIIYRLTDVMLMKAEALTVKPDPDFETAFCMVNAVNKRARDLVSPSAKDTLEFNDYNSREKMEQLVFDERNRELMFEGKRWFDLVRRSLRDGNSQYLASEATVKYEDNVNAIKIRLADLNYLFFPYYKEELKVNPYLIQNSAYGNTEEFEK